MFFNVTLYKKYLEKKKRRNMTAPKSSSRTCHSTKQPVQQAVFSFAVRVAYFRVPSPFGYAFLFKYVHKALKSID